MKRTHRTALLRFGDAADRRDQCQCCHGARVAGGNRGCERTAARDADHAVAGDAATAHQCLRIISVCLECWRGVGIAAAIAPTVRCDQAQTVGHGGIMGNAVFQARPWRAVQS